MGITDNYKKQIIMETKQKPFWKLSLNPITMWKYDSYTDELILSRRYLKKNKKDATSL